MRAVFVFLSIALAAAETVQYSTLALLTEASDDAALPSSQPSIAKVFLVCIVIYGVIGTLWFLFSRLSKETSSYDSMRIGLNCLTYAACAITMHMLNKSLATTLKEPSLISIAQMVVAVAFFGTIAGKQLLQSDRQALTTWCVVPTFFAAMLISSFYTYEYISLSMLTIMRNLTPLVVLPAEMMFMPADNRPTTNTMIIGSMIVMLFGAVLYGGALEISMIGVAFAVFNMVIAVCDRLIQRRLLTDHCRSMSSSVCSIMNNGLAIFPTLIMAGIANEFQGAASEEMAQHWTDPVVLIVLLLSGFVGMGVGYFGMEAQRDISATSVFVLQNTSKVGVVFLGITIFGDPIKSAGANIGLLLSLGGSFAYGHAQMTMQAEAKEKQKLIEEGEKTSA